MACLINEEVKSKVGSAVRFDESGKRDLTSLYADRSTLDAAVCELAALYEGKIDCVVSPGPMGYILGALLSEKLGVGFIPVKSCDSRIPVSDDAVRAAFIDHNNCVKALYCRKSLFAENARVLIADDWVATAATIQACAAIVEQAGGSVSAIASIGADYNSATARVIDTGLCSSIILRK